MRWDIILSIFSDWRMKFLAVFVTVTLLVASILTLAERRIRKKRKIKAIIRAQNTFIASIREKQRSNISAREKLDFIDEIAKNYLAEMYGTPVHSDYSYLRSEFARRGEKDIVAFCDVMFTAYYLERSSEQTEVKKAYNLFVILYTHRRNTKNAVSLLHIEDNFSNTEDSSETKQTKEETQKNSSKTSKTITPEEKTQKTQPKTPTITKQLFTHKIAEKISSQIQKMSKQKGKKGKKTLVSKQNEQSVTKVQKLPASLIEQLQPIKKQTEQAIDMLEEVPNIEPPSSTQKATTPEEKTQKIKDELGNERREWLKELRKKNSEKVIIRSTGTYDWLKDVKKELNIN